MLPKYKVNISI